jgi:hypothetical protein
VQDVSGSVFISYSRKDRAYVDKLAAHLSAARIRVWYDWGLAAGERFAFVIQQDRHRLVREHELLVLAVACVDPEQLADAAAGFAVTVKAVS